MSDSSSPETTIYGVAATDESRTKILEFERTWWPRAAHMVRHEVKRIEEALEALAAQGGAGDDVRSWDILAPSSGAFALRDWQVALVPAGSPAARLFGIDSGRSSCAARSLQADDRLLLRGALYYPGLAQSRGVLSVRDLLATYLSGCEQFVGDARFYLESTEPTDRLSLAMTGAVVDNVRGVGLSLLSASVDAGCAPMIHRFGAVVQTSVQLFTDLYEGTLDLADFQRRAHAAVVLLGGALSQFGATPNLVRLGQPSDEWAWRREADDFVTCFLSARAALTCQPDLVRDSTTICGVSRSGIETAFVLAEQARRTTQAAIVVEIWRPPDAVRPFSVELDDVTDRPVRSLICDDSSATGRTLAACARTLRADGRRIDGVVLAHGPESGRGLSGTGDLTNPDLYGTHILGIARRAPLERRSSGRPAPGDQPLVRDKQKERLARYLQRAGPTAFDVPCESHE